MNSERVFKKRGGGLGCLKTGKVAFETRKLAEKRLAEIQAQTRTTLKRSYRCPKCKLWHLTSDQNRRRRVHQRERLNDGLIPTKRVSKEAEIQKKE